MKNNTSLLLNAYQKNITELEHEKSALMDNLLAELSCIKRNSSALTAPIQSKISCWLIDSLIICNQIQQYKTTIEDIKMC
jgi:hypothetical protein